MSFIEKVWTEVMGSSPQLPSSMDKSIATSPRSSLERYDSAGSPLSPSTEGGYHGIPSLNLDERRRSADMASDGRTVMPRITKSISIAPQPPQMARRLDTSRSLPAHYDTGLSNLPSPASRKGENVWRSVFHPGSNKAGMDRVGATRFDKASSSEPSVFDWYNPLTI
ncbi:hypothetical protein CLOM_g20335 [Closterium sp. NIES-68]|nr:hypothetical protein CLOM_g20335 [Closterium sp. NIES-68]GJP59556.1 hypothetical protein CLOP_g12547 [Closterium sp. NIES-67]